MVGKVGVTCGYLAHVAFVLFASFCIFLGKYNSVINYLIEESQVKFKILFIFK